MPVGRHLATSLAHGFQPAAAGGVWNVWAPHAARLDLVLLSDKHRTTVPMRSCEGGWFQHASEFVEDGQRYLLRLNGDREVPDPASRWQPDGVHGPSAVWRPGKSDKADPLWQGIQLEDLVFYELHVGTFTTEGTFDAIVPRLAALRSLGVTAIELMPLFQFASRRGWGYDGTYWFAVHHAYGGPAGFARFVEACHTAGLAVFLDGVYNHLGPEGNYLAKFGPYFSSRYQTPWGQAVNFDGDGCQGVRSLVLDSVRYWLREFQLDGLRLDAVQTIHDASCPHILAEIKRVAAEESQRAGRPIHVIAESSLNDTWLLDPPARGGCGLDAQWNDDFHHTVHALLTGERIGYYADFFDPQRQLVKALTDVFVYDGQFSQFRGRVHGRPAGPHGGHRFVVGIQTHDQIGNRVHGERLARLTSPPQLRLATSLLLLAPHLPLLFMGEEYGEHNPFPFFCDFSDLDLQEAVRRGRREEFSHFAWETGVPDPFDPAVFAAAKLSWDWSEPSRAGLRNLYHDLLELRRRLPALRDFTHREAQLTRANDHHAVLVLTRGEPHNRVTILFQLTGGECELPSGTEELTPMLRSESRWYVDPTGTRPERAEAERAEAERAGAGLAQAERVEVERGPLRPFECLVLLPRMLSAVVSPGPS